MGKNSKIEWTQHTWNPWQGCRRISAGCQNCYMYAAKRRYGQNPMQIRKSQPETFELPLRLKAPGHVFVCSWSDFFLEEADPWRPTAWEIMRVCRHLTFQVLTKRPQNILRRLPPDWGAGYPNVWLGVTIEDAVNIGRARLLCNFPAAVRFISAEPLLSPVCWEALLRLYPIDWLVAGCESGPNRRPTERDWFRDARNACQACGVAFFLKQMAVNGRVVKMPALDNEVWAELPRARVRDRKLPEREI